MNQTRPQRLGRTMVESDPTWPGEPTPPKGTPNVVLCVFDDVGYSDFGCYGSEIRTPNIDRIGHDGAIFMDYLAEQSCTAGRNAFFTGMHPLRTGMIPPQLPGSPSWLRAGTPAVARCFSSVRSRFPLVSFTNTLDSS